MGNDAEIVGDGVADGFPFLRQGLVEEPEHRLGKLQEIGIEPIVRHMAMYDAP